MASCHVWQCHPPFLYGDVHSDGPCGGPSHAGSYQPHPVGAEHLGAVSIRKTVLPGMAIPMLKIRRPNGRLIFNMEIAIRR